MLSRRSLMYFFAVLLLVGTASINHAQAPPPGSIASPGSPLQLLTGVNPAQETPPGPSLSATTVFQTASVEQKPTGTVYTYNVGAQVKVINWAEDSSLVVTIEIWDKTTNAKLSETGIGGANGVANTPQHQVDYNATGYGPDKLGKGTYFCKVSATITPNGQPGQPIPPPINLTEVTTVDLPLR